MSGLDILVDGQFNIDMIDYAPAVSTGLLDIKFPRTNVAKTIKNWFGGTDSTIVGSPIYFDSFARLKARTNYIQSPNAASVQRTIIAAVKTTDTVTNNATTPVIAGNFVNLTRGFQFRYTATGVTANRAVNNEGTPGNSNASTATFPGPVILDKWRVVAVVFGGSVGAYTIQVFNLTENVIGNVVTHTQDPILGDNVRYGSHNDLYDGLIDIAALFDYNTALKKDQIDLIYDQIKAFLAEEAVPIVV